jgi:hypothetical protein
MTKDSRTPIERMVDAVAMYCTICGLASCDCWVPCSCGRVFEKGTECRNEIHRCTAMSDVATQCLEVKDHKGDHFDGAESWPRTKAKRRPSRSPSA